MGSFNAKSCGSISKFSQVTIGKSVREGQWEGNVGLCCQRGAIIVAPLMGLFMFITFASSVFQVGFL